MARVRTATEAIRNLERDAVIRALHASAAAGTIQAFYRQVGMRNPSRSYFVQYDDRQHSVKAVATYALQEVDPGAASTDFHATDAADRFRLLKLDVVHDNSAQNVARQKRWAQLLARHGQAKFREKLVDLYSKCAFTGCTTLRALDAAHVNPVRQDGLDHSTNGILLRADIHKLFDADLIAVNPADGRVHVSKQCQADYSDLAQSSFVSPPGGPPLSAFTVRWEDFRALRDS